MSSYKNYFLPSVEDVATMYGFPLSPRARSKPTQATTSLQSNNRPPQKTINPPNHQGEKPNRPSLTPTITPACYTDPDKTRNHRRKYR